MTEPTPIGPGRYTVPGNRWDLLPAVAPSAPEVSVVVPFYDNQHDLDLLLAGLSVQTHPRSRMQVVIADDGSPEHPRIPEVANGLDIVIMRQDDRGFRAGAARNLGVRRADGVVILFLDGDTVPTPDYVHILGQRPAVLPEAVVTGRRRYADLSAWTTADLLAWFADGTATPPQWDEPAWLTNEYIRTGDLRSIHARSYKYLIGAVLGCCRDFFAEIGGFDETITGYGGEDYDLTYRAQNAGAILGYVPDAVAWHDGPDWAGRTDPTRQTVQKNREVMMLAERIPEPSMRGPGQSYPVVDVIVTVHPDGWSLGAGVLCLRSLLSTLDCGVWIDGTSESTQQLRKAFAGDQRVRSRSISADPNSSVRRRARLQMDVLAPALISGFFADLLSRLLAEDLGTLTVTAAEGMVLTVESSRSRFRRERFPTLDPAAAMALFARLTCADQDCGVVPIREEPALAAVFGGYA